MHLPAFPRLLALAAAITLAAAPPAGAAPGDLDTTFGGTGKITTVFGALSVGSGVAAQSDGKMIVAGETGTTTVQDVGLVRYNDDGSLDTTFGGTGKVITSISSMVGTSDVARCVAVQSNGRIVVAGTSWVGTSYIFAVVRYNANGSLDTTFGSTGTVTTAIGTTECQANCLALQSDGKIVVGGYSALSSGDWDFAVVRYNANGTLDTTFGVGGKVVTTIGTSLDDVRSVAIQSDGKILVTGNTLVPPYKFALVRYNVNGSLDTTFGGTGKVITSTGTNDKPESVVVQGDGKILVAGRSRIFSFYDYSLMRFNVDGSLDPTFGTAGVVTTPMGASDDRIFSMALQGNGKIVVAGYSTVGANNDVTMARYNPNGSLDTTFGAGGKVITASATNDLVQSLVVRGDGKIVLAGYSVVGNAAMTIWRYLGDPPDTTTQPPVLTSPASNAVSASPVSIGFTLPEAALPGSVTLSFGATVLTLAASQESSGAHSFSFAPANPTASPQVASGAAIADGSYTVTLSYRDAVGNPVASAFSTNVTIDTMPPETAITGGPAAVTTQTIAAFQFSAIPSATSFEVSLDGAAFSARSSPVVVGGLADGEHTFRVRALDAVGNVDATPASWTWRVDTIRPDTTITSGPGGTMGEAVFAFGATEPATFECVLDGGVPEMEASPRSYSGLRQGPHTFSVVAIDAAGNRDASPAVVSWTVVLPPVHTRAWSKRGLVAHVGEPLMTQVPVGAVWAGFGVPAINDAGDVVFLGKWTHPAGKGEAVFERSATTGELEIVLQRGSPPPPDSSLPPDATLKTLKDPLLAPNGNVLTPVTLAGTGISNANDAALIWSPRTGDARVVAREGEAVDGARVGKFLGISIVERGVVFTTLLHGATAANDLAVCSWDEAEGLRVLVREGWTLDEGEGLRLVPRAAAPGERTLRGFKTLVAGAAAPGQGRGMHGEGPAIGLLAKLSDGSSAVLSVDAFGEVTVYSESGFKSYGVPAWGADFAAPAFFAVPESGAKGIFQHDDATGLVEPLLQVGGEVRSLKDPVLSPDAMRRAWMGATTAARAVWQKVDASDAEIVALAGTQAAEVPAGALWEGFKSLAISNRGPLLSAVLAQGAGGVDGSNDAGLWAVDGVGALRLLFREGDTIGGKVLKGFTVLKAAAGSPGVTRAFNDNAQVVWRASYTDGTSAVVVTTIP